MTIRDLVTSKLPAWLLFAPVVGAVLFYILAEGGSTDDAL